MKCLAIFIPLLMISGCATPVVDQKCAYDRNKMLSMSEESFDQDLSDGGGGWRRIANIPGCELAAADLIAEYRVEHPESASVVTWHEGQMRAAAGQYEQAIPLLIAAKKDPAKDLGGWNQYVDATVAFLQGDMPALQKARDELAAVPYTPAEGMPALKDGYVEFPSQPGQPVMRFRWPINIEVVDALVACFGKPYNIAYGPTCRVQSK